MMTNSCIAIALLSCCDRAAIWANQNVPVDESAGIVWEDFSTTVKEACVPPDTETRLECDWE